MLWISVTSEIQLRILWPTTRLARFIPGTALALHWHCTDEVRALYLHFTWNLHRTCIVLASYLHRTCIVRALYCQSTGIVLGPLRSPPSVRIREAACHVPRSRDGSEAQPLIILRFAALPRGLESRVTPEMAMPPWNSRLLCAGPPGQRTKPGGRIRRPRRACLSLSTPRIHLRARQDMTPAALPGVFGFALT